MSWLEQVSEKIAAASGQDPMSLRITHDQMQALLDLAGVAAHSSGNRTNAPLLCYVLGLAVARGAVLSELAEVVRAATPDDS